MESVLFFLVIAVAFLHLGFMILEIFFWSKPIGLKIFRMNHERAKSTATLASNQGLYNGFLAAGLLWALFVSDPDFSRSLKIFFLTCVFIAGSYGGATVGKKIFFLQGVPAIVGLFLILLSYLKYHQG